MSAQISGAQSFVLRVRLASCPPAVHQQAAKKGFVIPAKAGIQYFEFPFPLDSHPALAAGGFAGMTFGMVVETSLFSTGC